MNSAEVEGGPRRPDAGGMNSHRELMLPPRRCVDCGLLDCTVLISTGSGALICRSCLRETTASGNVPSPPAPRLELHMRRVEQREEGGACR